MDASIHHPPVTPSAQRDLSPPPGKEPAAWKAALACAMGEDAVAKWGKQLLRITNDMVVICNEKMDIVAARSTMRGHTTHTLRTA